ncbi:hypothetical protein [Hyalangium gracile]|uniref:hypothetical protein n=1 Tax=Hyalangium gracile TaxID=394092 RepID=UPI001CCE9A07|nr:hypothetical protein [Hyalangium gracile]
MNYFFIPQREGLLPAPRFLQLLRSRWPHAQVEQVHDPADNHALEFSIPMTHSRVDGSLNREGSAVVFVGEIRDCAEFALWCQSLLPAGETASFCDESMSGSLDLDAGTSRADILRAFSVRPDQES